MRPEGEKFDEEHGKQMELVRQKAYRKTFELACSQLSALPLEERVAKAGLRLDRRDGGYHVSVPFFEETIDITVPGFSFAGAEGRNTTLTTKIVLLHYIAHASGSPFGVDLVPYEDIPGCRPYLPVFERRVTKPLLSAFGHDRDAFLQAGRSLGAKVEEYGNASFTVMALPMVPITFILWEGDEDFPASLRVLFDRSIHTYLPLEDIVVISKMAATRIIKQARKESYPDL